MDTLHRLRELHLIANENDVRGGSCHSDKIAQSNLTSLVDKEVVERVRVIPGKMKRRAADQPVMYADVIRNRD